ncbi:hypothetical protein KY084_13060 [Stakelama sp. CBK3Z-3]|uniref:YncE family protein n=1 Tax=Stakelama flava TaxID=2860338 RepID=A0ABS6XNK5_9SPHN|nr:cytochrome D1 domain-containing protein [Stakelama flava]MBW4331797.1 hypothetical protein [Stakelama flava]
MRYLLLGLAMTLSVPANAQDGTLLVGNRDEESISLIALDSGRQIAKVATDHHPGALALSPDGKLAAVVAQDGAAIDLIDVAKRRLAATIDIGPDRLAIDVKWIDSDHMVVAAKDSGSVAIVSRDGSVRSIPMGKDQPAMVTVSPNGRRAYTTNTEAGTVSVLDLDKNVKLRDIKVLGKPEALTLARDGRELWVGDLSDPRVQIIDLATDKAVATLPVSPLAVRLAASPDGRYVAASAIDTGTVGLFDAERHVPVRTISVSDDGAAKQAAILFSSDSQRLYAVETARDTVAEIDVASGEVTRRFATGRGGDGLAIAPTAQ